MLKVVNSRDYIRKYSENISESFGGANLKESPYNMEYIIMQEFNWWLVGFIFMATVGGLTSLFGWWWLLGVPALLVYVWYK